MKYFLLTLKILGFTLLGIAAVLLLFLLLPFAAKIKYKEGVLSVKIRIFFIWIKIYPAKKKKGRKNKKEDPEPEPEGEKKEKSKIDLELIKQLMPPAKSLLGRLLRSIHVKDLNFNLIARGKDAAAVGIKAGAMWAGIGTLTALLKNVFDIRIKNITVVPDFLDEYEGREEFDCKIVAIPLIILIAGLAFLIKLLAVLAGRRDDEKQSEK